MIDGEPGLRDAIDVLLEAKRVAPELGLAPQVPAIQGFIVSELARLETLHIPRDARSQSEPLLSALFRDVLRETWGYMLRG